MTPFAYRRTYPLDARFAVEFVLDGNSFKAEWAPHQPKGRKARNLLPAYRIARADFLGSLGLNVMVIEA